MEILTLWETPIVITQKKFSNQSELLELAVSCTGTEDITGTFLPGKKFLNDPKIAELKNWILETANTSVEKINGEFWNKQYSAKFLDMWSWSSKDYSNPLHSHPNTSWAGVYCLDPGTPSNKAHNGSTIFYSPGNWGTFLDAGLAFLDRRAYHIHNLKAGDLILFPGFLKHSAQYSGITPRTVIAFNLIFE